MNFLYFIILAIVIYSTLLLGGQKYRSTALYALAIGGVVNANFFNSVTYPINCFGLEFGIDSIIYTLFIFCVIVMLIWKDKREAYLLAFSSIIAIVFSAVMQLLADIMSNGSIVAAWSTFGSFMISAFASVVAIVAMIEILNKLKSKINTYLLIILGTVVAIVLNSGIYYPLMALISGMPNNIGEILLTSVIGKAIALAVSLLTYYLLTLIDKTRSK